MDGSVQIGTDMKIGRVVSVSGSQVLCVLDTDANNNKAAASFLQIGSLVKLETPVAQTFGIITALTNPLPADDPNERETHIFELVLIGETPHPAPGEETYFRRGVSLMPSLSAEVTTAGTKELGQVYAPPSVANISIGTIHQDSRLEAHAMTDELISKHFAVLGTTGSGKSSATTVIIKSLIENNPNAHIIMLDPHSEYAGAFSDVADILTPKSLELPYWILNFEELLQVLFGGRFDTGSAEAEILGDLIPAAKKDYIGDRGEDAPISPDTPIPYRLSDLIRRLDNGMGRITDAEERRPYRRIRTRLAALQDDSRYAFMFGSFDTRDRMTAILSRLFRIPVNGKPMSIIDLSGIPSEVVSVVVAVVGRLTFDFAIWSDRSVPILLVCEEAHRYSPSEPGVGAELSQRVLSKIAKEGRKYGVSLAVISQRPSKLSSDLLSQCNTIFAMRMSSTEDHEFVRGAIADSFAGLLSVLPSLRNGECIAVGQGVPVPYRMRFRTLQQHELPAGGAPNVSEMWRDDLANVDFLKSVVERWRMRNDENDPRAIRQVDIPAAPDPEPTPQPVHQTMITETQSGQEQFPPEYDLRREPRPATAPESEFPSVFKDV